MPFIKYADFHSFTPQLSTYQPNPELKVLTIPSNIRNTSPRTLILSQRKFSTISAQDVEKRFETRDYPANRPSGIKTGVNCKVIEKFKDESASKQIVEFVCLRAVLYSYKMLDGN